MCLIEDRLLYTRPNILHTHDGPIMRNGVNEDTKALGRVALLRVVVREAFVQIRSMQAVTLVLDMLFLCLIDNLLLHDSAELTNERMHVCTYAYYEMRYVHEEHICIGMSSLDSKSFPFSLGRREVRVMSRRTARCCCF